MAYLFLGPVWLHFLFDDRTGCRLYACGGSVFGPFVGKMHVNLVDQLFQLGVNSMYHEVVYLGVQPFLKTFGSTRQFLPLARLFVIGMFAPFVG
jgi:hypothetical protein